MSFDFAKVAIQPKLKTRAPVDAHEQDADSVTEQIIRMIDPSNSIMH